MVAATEGNGLVVENDVYDPSSGQSVPQIVQLDSTGTPGNTATITIGALP